MIKEIITYPSPFLKKKTKKISLSKDNEIVERVVQDCLDTMFAHGEALAIAANQIGYSISMFVVNPETECNFSLVEEFGHIFINPNISWKSKEEIDMYEACLSVPGISLPISRPKEIELEFSDLIGNIHKQKFDGLYSRLTQHETGHLNGELFINLIKRK